MPRLRDSLLLAFAGAICWAMATTGQGCSDSALVGGGGALNTGGFGGTTQGLGGINYATCAACLDPMSGAPVHQCQEEVDACDADPACRALVACADEGVDVTSSGTGGTTSSGAAGGAGGTSSNGAGGTGGGGGGATASGGGTSTSTSTSTSQGAGGASSGTSHGACDTSVFGACCLLDCASALDAPADSKERFLQRTRCLDCATCKTQCTISDAFCAALQDGAQTNCD